MVSKEKDVYPKLDDSIVRNEFIEWYVHAHLETIARETLNEMKSLGRINLQGLVTLLSKNRLPYSRMDINLIFRALQNVAAQKGKPFVTIPVLVQDLMGNITCADIEFELCYKGDYTWD